MVLVLAGIHFTALTILFHWLRNGQAAWSRVPLTPVPILLAAFGGVLAIHTVEIWLFACLYLVLHAFPDVETALYFSAITYSSIGYGDVVLVKDWRLVGAIEGAAGVILLGCSTAFIVAVVTELKLFDRPRASRPRKQERGPRR